MAHDCVTPTCFAVGVAPTPLVLNSCSLPCERLSICPPKQTNMHAETAHSKNLPRVDLLGSSQHYKGLRYSRFKGAYF